MRKYYLLVLILFFCAAAAQAQYVSIPDDVFRTRLQQRYPGCFNASGMMDTTCKDLVELTELDCGDWGIASLEGIQYFKELNYLDCIHNQLTALPPLPAKLLNLTCYSNQLTALPVLPAKLQYMDCTDNPGLLCLPMLPQDMVSLYIDTTVIRCLPNKPVYMTVYFEGSTKRMPICSSNDNPNGCTLSATCTWHNISSSNWENPANWDCNKVPGPATNVIISAGTVLLNSNITVKSITIAPGATLEVGAGYQLTVLQ